MKKMKTVFLLAFLAVLTASCSKKDSNSTARSEAAAAPVAETAVNELMPVEIDEDEESDLAGLTPTGPLSLTTYEEFIAYLSSHNPRTRIPMQIAPISNQAPSSTPAKLYFANKDTALAYNKMDKFAQDAATQATFLYTSSIAQNPSVVETCIGRFFTSGTSIDLAGVPACCAPSNEKKYRENVQDKEAKISRIMSRKFKREKNLYSNRVNRLILNSLEYQMKSNCVHTDIMNVYLDAVEKILEIRQSLPAKESVAPEKTSTPTEVETDYVDPRS